MDDIISRFRRAISQRHTYHNVSVVSSFYLLCCNYTLKHLTKYRKYKTTCKYMYILAQPKNQEVPVCTCVLVCNAKFYGRLRLIRSVLRALKFPVFKLIEIVILRVYYTIPFGFSLFRHFWDNTFQL